MARFANEFQRGVMLDAYGCVDVVIEGLAFYGATSTSPTYAGARAGILFPYKPGSGGASELTCRNCTFSYFNSSTGGNPSIFPTATAGVQVGFAVSDGGCDQTRFFECGFVSSIAGILYVNNQSLGHELHGCGMSLVTNCVWVQAGGNMQWTGGIIEACSTVLRLGLTFYPFSGGGPNAAVFMLENIRTERGSLATDITLLDATALQSGFFR